MPQRQRYSLELRKGAVPASDDTALALQFNDAVRSAQIGFARAVSSAIGATDGLEGSAVEVARVYRAISDILEMDLAMEEERENALDAAWEALCCQGAIGNVLALQDVYVWAVRLRNAAAKDVYGKERDVGSKQAREEVRLVQAWNSRAAALFDRVVLRSGAGERRVPSREEALLSAEEDHAETPVVEAALAPQFSPSWLRLRCGQLAAVKGGYGLSAAEMAMSVLSILTSASRRDDEIQSELFDAFAGDFEAVADVLGRRTALQEHSDAVLADCSQAQEMSAQGLDPDAAGDFSSSSSQTRAISRGVAKRGSRGRGKRNHVGESNEPDRATINSQFTIRNVREEAFEKERRKQEMLAMRAGLLPNRTANQNEDEDDGPGLPALGGSMYDELQKAFPGIELDSNSSIGAVDRVGLPKGSTREVGKGYEEIFVPPPQPGSAAKNAKLIDIATALRDHPELLGAMRGVTTLNRLQSAVYPAAFESNENILVCAPTGAGKTNVALLTIFREIVAVKRRQQRAFKVVYVAPMKALAAEVTEKFGDRLKPLGLRVREFTGDMSLTRKEALETHVLVTTPEKWDVVTRKSGSDLSDAVTLFIVDEIHLLHDDRGAVLESIVARMLRLSETAQRRIRLVALSATLPNYADVAAFMRVTPSKGLFHFDGSHRPVPLSQTFIGVSEGGTSNSGEARRRREAKVHELAWAKVKDSLQRGHQAMIFVHSRKKTSTAAREMLSLAAQDQVEDILLGGESKHASNASAANGDGNAENADDDNAPATVLPSWAAKEISKSRTADVRELCARGVGIHNAGLPRPDRKLVEKLFAEGVIRVLCCTATLAWGINLPARTVVIMGTEVYDAQKGGFVQLGMLDVMQIFGRAGRPQYDTEGEGVIITMHEHLGKYLSLLTSSVPIESKLGASASRLADHLNAEIVSGTVSSIGEGVKWLSYTYLSVRMAQNPLVYGIDWTEVASDPGLHSRRATLVEQAAKALDDAKMCRYDPRTGVLAPSDLGRVSSHFYVSHRTVVLWNELLGNLALGGAVSEEDWEKMYSTVLHAVSCASEFEQMRSRQEESEELEALSRLACPIRNKSGSETREGKVTILLQAYISRAPIKLADLSYVVQSSTRLLRALFEISLRRGLPSLSLAALELARSSESRIWPFEHPLRQFMHMTRRVSGLILSPETVGAIEDAGADGSLVALRGMTKDEMSVLVRSPKMALSVKRAVEAVPTLELVQATVAPLTRTVLSIRVLLRPTFRWNDALHGNAESWWLWIEDHEEERVYHSERIVMTKRQVQSMVEQSDVEKQGGISLNLTVPVFDPPSSQYWVRVESEQWHTGGGSSAVLSLHNMALPQREPPHTGLLDLRPLPVTAALNAEQATALYSGRFTHFNPLQTQLFHLARHSDENLLVGAPTGSGKTVIAELAVLRALDSSPNKCIVYIAPLLALVRERVKDWGARFGQALGKTVMELGTADLHHPSDPAEVLSRADILIATPEVWNSVSKAWGHAEFVDRTSLVVFDELHLLGTEHKEAFEIVISRTRRLSVLAAAAVCSENVKGALSSPIRIIALSISLANARELADWMGVSAAKGLFNFNSSVRPVPCEIHVTGIAGERYGHRMHSMNRPAFSAISRYSPGKPVLVFVSSRRQTHLTALDLIRLAAVDGKPRRFVGTSNVSEIDNAVRDVSDNVLKRTLPFGIAVYHPGLSIRDREKVKHLFSSGATQVLISTTTSAWGMDLSAFLVIIKGTETYDAKQRRYVDMPVTDVLQMMGRAGRPYCDSQSYAMLLVHEPKKTFLKKFLYEPFPVESCLHHELADYINMEIALGAIAGPQDVLDCFTWTYFFRRMIMNPGFYGIVTSSAEGARGDSYVKQSVRPSAQMISSHCSTLVTSVLKQLQAAKCITVSECCAGGSPSSHASEATTSKIAKSSSKVFSKDLVLESSALGRICTSHGLTYRSASRLGHGMKCGMSVEEIVCMISACSEFTNLTLRHDDDLLNDEFGRSIADAFVSLGRYSNRSNALRGLRMERTVSSACTKVRLLIFGHLARVPPPTQDYLGDFRSVLEQTSSVLDAILEYAAESGMLSTARQCVELMQMLYQGHLVTDDACSVLLNDVGGFDAAKVREEGLRTLKDAVQKAPELRALLTRIGVPPRACTAASRFVCSVPEVVLSGTMCLNEDGSHTAHIMLQEQRREGSEGRLSQFAETLSRRVAKRQHGYVVIVGDSNSDHLVALQRVPSLQCASSPATRSLDLRLPSHVEYEGVTALSVLVMSDAYIGMDQEVTLS